MILKHFISSAYSCTVVLECIALGAIFILIINKSGPKLDPWGTPDDIGNNNDSQPSMTVLWCLHVEYDLNQKQESSIPLILTSNSSFVQVKASFENQLQGEAFECHYVTFESFPCTFHVKWHILLPQCFLISFFFKHIFHCFPQKHLGLMKGITILEI